VLERSPEIMDHADSHGPSPRSSTDEHGQSPSGPPVDERSWDERYRSRSSLWSANPNPQLVSEASALPPGVALDVGSGEGADAIWLAQRGWEVTAVDFSRVALERGEARAADVGTDVAQRIGWLHRDLTVWTPAEAAYDLVSAQFMDLPKDARESLFRRIGASVAPAGFLLIVGHHPSDLQTAVPRPQMPELFYTPADLAGALDPSEWEIVVDATRERTTTDPRGQTATVHDTVLRARRLR